MAWLILSLEHVFAFWTSCARGQIGAAFAFDRFSLLFWLETLLLVIPSVYLLTRRNNRLIPSRLFLADVADRCGRNALSVRSHQLRLHCAAGSGLLPVGNRGHHRRWVYVCLAIAAFMARRSKYLPILPRAGFRLV